MKWQGQHWFHFLHIQNGIKNVISVNEGNNISAYYSWKIIITIIIIIIILIFIIIIVVVIVVVIIITIIIQVALGYILFIILHI